jgi:hypothetical protein
VLAIMAALRKRIQTNKEGKRTLEELLEADED